MSIRLIAIGLVVAFVAIDMIGYWYALNIETPPPHIKHADLGSREDVFFGVISRYTPRSIIEGYQPLMDYLTEKTLTHFNLWHNIWDRQGKLIKLQIT